MAWSGPEQDRRTREREHHPRAVVLVGADEADVGDAARVLHQARVREVEVGGTLEAVRDAQELIGGVLDRRDAGADVDDVRAHRAQAFGPLEGRAVERPRIEDA